MEQNSIRVKMKIMEHARDLPLPSYMTPGSSGMDLRAAVSEPVVLEPGETALVPTGLQTAVPRGYELQIRPRSGLAVKNGIGILNAPGTIDADYRGEIKVILINLGSDVFTVDRGLRMAQMVLCPVLTMELEKVAELPPTHRGEGGFGYTGKG